MGGGTSAGLLRLVLAGVIVVTPVAIASAAAPAGPTRTLSVASAGAGVISSADRRIRCAPRCRASFRRGKVVTLKAAPRPNLDFRRWLSGCAHLRRIGTPREQADEEPNLLGAEVSYSFSTSTLRGHELAIAWSLVRIERDDTLGPVDPTQDRAPAQTVTPQECDTVRGNDLFVQIPERGRRYRVVLELHGGEDLRDRLALMEIAIFRG